MSAELKTLIIRHPTHISTIHRAIQLITENDADPNTEHPTHKMNILYPVIDYGSLEFVKTMISLGVNPRHVDSMGYAPIDIACQNHNYNIVEFFLKEIGVDPNEYVDRETRIHILCCTNRIDDYTDACNDEQIFKIIELFIAYGADINRKDLRRGMTPLQIAIENERMFVYPKYTLSQRLIQIGAK